MTNLMEALFDYLNESRVGDCLAADQEYSINSARTDAWSLDPLKHLDNDGQALFHQLQQAAFQESICLQRATFQATLDLCRELNGMLRG